MNSKKYQDHEKDLLKSILSKSLSSSHPSSETIANAQSYSGVNSSNPLNKLKYKLIEEYEDKSIEDISGTKIIENKYGETIQIKHSEKIVFNTEKNDFKEEIFCDLKLIPGIGQATENKLKEQGFKDIPSLLKHDKYCKHAKIAIEQLDSNSFKDIFNIVRKNSQSQNNVLKCLSGINYENFKFMDIETLGLSNVPIILIGVAELSKNGKSIESNQYLLREKSEEPAVLEAFMSHLDENSVYVSYNGASFDIPFIKNRCDYYRIKNEHNLIHYDLLYYARRLWRSKLPNCKLTTVEKHLFDIERVDDVPGSYIPSFYKSYEKENNIGPLIPIIEHNRMDIISLAKFLMKMYEEVC